MADNLNVPGGSAGPAATDEIGGIHFQRIKLVHGADGVNAGDVSTSNRYPVEDTSSSVVGSGTQATAQRVTIATDNAVIGATNETAASSDTATAGLNGRLQRIAQNITSLLTLTGAVGETAPASDTASSGLNGRLQRIAQNITSLIALVPASLGQKTMANSFAVTVASNQTFIPVTTAENSVVVSISGATVNSTGTSGYTAGNLVGSKLTLSSTGTNKAVKLINVTIRLHDLNSGTSPAFDVVFFNADPSATTFGDKTAFTINSADWEKVSGVAVLTASNFSRIYDGGSNDGQVGTLNNANIILSQSGGTMYAGIIARSAFATSADDLISITFGFTGDI